MSVTMPTYILFATDDSTLIETDAAFRHSYKGRGFQEILELRAKQICVAYSMWRWENTPLTDTEQELTKDQFRTYHQGLADMFIKIREVDGVWQFDKALSVAEWEFFKAAMIQTQGYHAEISGLDEEEAEAEVMVPNPETIEKFIARNFSEFVDSIREQHDKYQWDTHLVKVTGMDKKGWLANRKVERQEIKQVKIKKKE